MSSRQNFRQSPEAHRAIVVALNTEQLVRSYGTDCKVCADSLTIQWGDGGASIETLAEEGFTSATQAGSPIWDAYMAWHAPR